MSDSLLNKSAVVVNAIAITAALAILSGQLPLGSLPHQVKLNSNFNPIQFSFRP
jgi:hypothetical protein